MCYDTSVAYGVVNLEVPQGTYVQYIPAVLLTFHHVFLCMCVCVCVCVHVYICVCTCVIFRYLLTHSQGPSSRRAKERPPSPSTTSSTSPLHPPVEVWGGEGISPCVPTSTGPCTTSARSSSCRPSKYFEW